ncbi:SEC-C metal-binding domain-containing protein [Vibrio sp. YMD68]|uniref:SEC-C metal-binding domain-containing protein n=1 Tax=Vibrio sp. YMD68 TaxID=3042300 RepID=UPI002499B736|nr:SEC-C metal-binding domain-containing protein [Vibrio sp. YMD68]WGV98843.1 SEC-C metal-binding domain-containing protein [Vibrio sp. YMD68]WGW01230.1 SEC-C metal-binding domain-containing protein [Vibrio sp. YMD68]
MMDCSTGRLIELIGNPKEITELKAKFEKQNRRPLLKLTEEQATELAPLEPYKRKGRMRNKPCPCGSGNKFKDCCWAKYL